MATPAHKFTWGDVVRVTAEAPAHLRPCAFGSVVAVDIVAKDEAMRRVAQKQAAPIYTVEFGDGSDAEIPEVFLEPG